jgi:hypothetical protein
LVRPVSLIAFLIALAVACGGGEAVGPSPSPTATEKRTPKPTRSATPVPTQALTIEATPDPTPEQTPEPTPEPVTSVDLSASHARQGGFMLVRLLYPPAGLSEASVRFNGSFYPMLLSGDRWFALVGLPTDIATGEYPVVVASGGTPITQGLLTVGDGAFQYESLELPPSSIGLLNDPAAISAERATLAGVFGRFSPAQQWSGAWIMPASGVITNGFGLMRSINGGPYYPHTGTDIANDKGTPIAAAATGVVALARPLYLYGNVVVIDHGAGVFSGYNHLDSISVTEGQAVSIGDLVGFMGETGFVSGPHLHWEVVIGGVRTEPMLWVQEAVEP